METSFYYSVNGKEITVGVTEYNLNRGDKINFDFRSWN
ncbi:DUF4430 domain-containing protein [Bacillus thuringiensis]|nr:DUF4430 domain-containing protein [Bacillus thuringiensis]MCU7666878.1 DUF4430 domain-containing protein [Bacillus thuringiensis]